jgi:hypothetical protein
MTHPNPGMRRYQPWARVPILRRAFVFAAKVGYLELLPFMALIYYGSPSIGRLNLHQYRLLDPISAR